MSIMHCAFSTKESVQGEGLMRGCKYGSIVGNDKDVQEIGFLCNGCSRVPNCM